MIEQQAGREGVLERLSQLKGVQQVLLLDERGQILAMSKRAGDAIALASVAASSVAAAKALAALVRTESFTSIHYDSASTQLLLADIGAACLVMLCDGKLPAGFVRYQVRLSQSDLTAYAQTLLEKRNKQLNPLCDVTDADLERLFA